MDPHSKSNFIYGFKFNQVSITRNVENQCPEGPSNNFGFMDDNPFLLPPDNPNNAQNSASMSTITTTDEDSPLDEIDFSATVLRYINQMLMEEKPCMFHDSLALQAAEKSLYEVIGESKSYPSSSIQNHHNLDSPGDSLSSNFGGNSSSGTTSTSNSVDSTQWSNVDLAEYKPSILQTTLPADFVFQASSTFTNQSSMYNRTTFTVTNNGILGNSRAGVLDSTFLSKSESVLQFERGVEEANKFLPKGNPFVIDLGNRTFTPSFQKGPQQLVIKTERDEREHFSDESRGRKNHGWEDETDLQDGRSNKQSAVYRDDSEELSELFDKVLLGTGCGNKAPPMHNEDHSNGPDMTMQKNEESNRSGGGKSRVKKQGNKKGVVDLRTLLVMCAQAVSSDDRVTANELLKQVRQHSSPLGDGSQRLAHCFANALEARLAGTGIQIYTALSSKRTSAADMVKAYQMYISACPFKKLAIIFANHTNFEPSQRQGCENSSCCRFWYPLWLPVACPYFSSVKSTWWSSKAAHDRDRAPATWFQASRVSPGDRASPSKVLQSL